ncbi:hypothetical protein [uncultured Roseivirga sp.]|uniref:hypothetical protein n=1 Tax=uncultured Roseivirga sp. TaxID=543088 RepID=UPI000D791E98|nr:hypothetical protein [uncultured Roseivirga sp.]PWL31207.1 MAG: hypothetical protein DCO95_06955 [Roseivirga sp. XM-24bin3]
MKTLYKIGGSAALAQAAIYIFGFILLIGSLNPEASSLSINERLAFLSNNQALYQLWIFVIYVLFGVVLVFLSFALNGTLKAKQPILSGIAVIFGYIWSVLVIASGMITNIGLEATLTRQPKNIQQASQLWLTIETLQNGLGGGVEVVGGIWVLLVTLAGLKAHQLPKAMHWLGLLVGLAGILTVIPGLGDLGVVFGLLQIIWFAWLGIVLLKTKD